MSDPHEHKPREGWSYSGEVWTDGAGHAVVVLPPFVRTHGHGFEYELEPLGASCAANVAQEIVDDRFTIATDEPHVKVVWRVTPVRSCEVERSGPTDGALGESETKIRR